MRYGINAFFYITHMSGVHGSIVKNEKSYMKLITHEDSYHLHKLFGAYVLGNFIYQHYLYIVIGDMNLTLFNLIPHILLHLSSLQFRVLAKRETETEKMKMFIWEELRLHSFVFALRAILVIWFQEFSYFIVLSTMLVADNITFSCGTQNVTTVRGVHTRNSNSLAKKLTGQFFSISQIGATIICSGMFQCKFSSALAFSTLPPIQTSAFGMTLLRKNIITKQMWQIIYTGQLLWVYVMWYLETGNLWIFPLSISGLMMRKTAISKYMMFCYFGLLHWTIYITFEVLNNPTIELEF